MKTVHAPAKINLFLDILGKREDGYHDIHTACVAIDLYDKISMWIDGRLNRNGPSPIVELTVEGPYAHGVPTDETNLIARALREFEKEMGREFPTIGVKLHKNIPHGAGLGGGSSDAAAALRAARELLAITDADDDRLTHIAERIGSDCPFFIKGGAAEAAGRGELLSPLSERHLLLLLAWPRFPISTRDAYAQITSKQFGRYSDAQALRRWMASEPIDTPLLENAFELVVPRRFPQIAQNIKQMTWDGAIIARMSGSGSATFGVFMDNTQRHEAFEHLHRENDCFLCRSVAARRLRTDESDSHLPIPPPDD